MNKKMIKCLTIISITGILLSSCSPKVVNQTTPYKPLHPELTFVAKGACYSDAADIYFIITQELNLPVRIQIGNYIGTKSLHAQVEYEKSPNNWVPLMLIDGEVYEDSNHLESVKDTFNIVDLFFYCSKIGLYKKLNRNK